MKCSKCGTEYTDDVCPACGGETEKAKQVVKFRRKANKIMWSVLIFIFALVIVAISLFSYILTPKQEEKLKSAVIAISQEAVSSELKTPATADFPLGYDSYVIHQNGNNYTVTSYVDAENSFGAKLRNIFTVDLEYYPDTEKYKVHRVKIK